VIPSPRAILPDVIEAVEAAGRMVADEFCLPEGPRFSDHVTAPVDHAIELFLRDRLTALLPARFVGEEAGVLEAPANGFCWVVDPHDGTRAYLEGRRGSAVSVALLRGGEPVLGVVFAPLSPDRGPDLIAWAEGGAMTRNGLEVAIDLSQRQLAAGDVVFLNHGAWQRPVWHGGAVAPGRFMPLPSIAYRLARVAVGDGIATLTLRPVNALDVVAGHALLLAAGGVLVAEDGVPVTYTEQGASRPSACFGGAPAAVAALRARIWRGSTEQRREPRVALGWPRAAEGVALDRAIGCLLGQVIGDSLGSLVEFQSAAAIARAYPDGVRALADGGTWDTIAGQPTDDSELALALARVLAGRESYDAEAAAAAYARWFASGPFDCGNTTRRALGATARATAARAAGKAGAAQAAADRRSQGNGSLMRVAPIGIWAGSAETAAAAAMVDSTLTHPHPVCLAACGAYAAAIATGIAGGDRAAMRDTARAVAFGAGRAAEAVVATLDRAASGTEPADFQHQMGWVLTALGNAFFHLAVTADPAEALVRTVGAGGDTDTNAAIAGALLGAAEGRAAWPVRWAMPVLTCRPDAGLGVARPRPEEYRPDDLLDLAEALLPRRSPQPRCP
jgi:ADP-ribosylglycohydrolase/fructose-1,6-bisphosphatase/inositol monophosphatase family enzyme